MSKIKDSDIRMNCPDKTTCYEHLHNLAVLKAYRKECKLSKKYFACLQEIREYCEEQNLKADYTACEILDKINSVIGAE